MVISIKTKYLPGLGTSKNVQCLPADKWAKTPVVNIDIVNDPISSQDYNKDTGTTLFKSERNEKVPLTQGWKEKLKSWQLTKEGESSPYTCAYKLVSIYFKWFGLQDSAEKELQREFNRLFTNFHREVFCWMDRWYGLTLADIRKFEKEAAGKTAQKT